MLHYTLLLPGASPVYFVCIDLLWQESLVQITLHIQCIHPELWMFPNNSIFIFSNYEIQQSSHY